MKTYAKTIAIYLKKKKEIKKIETKQINFNAKITTYTNRS